MCAALPMSLWVRSGHMQRNKACPLTPNSDQKSGHPHKVMSALPPTADMCVALADVSFGPIADIEFTAPTKNPERSAFTSGGFPATN